MKNKGSRFTSWYYYFKPKPIKLMCQYQRWKEIAKDQGISRDALMHLNWIIFYETKANYNASLTCRHFGIPAKTFYKYLNRFDSTDFSSLEPRSRAPKRVRQRQITLEQEQRIIKLRNKYLCYGKEKLRQEYLEIYKEDISCHKIYYTIRKHHLYRDKVRIQRARRRSALRINKQRISTLKKRNKQALGHLIQVDTIVLHLFGIKRYILTGIDKYGKLAYARCYRNQSSYSATDFLIRLNYLIDDQIVNIQTDNGSEFSKHFERACTTLGISHYFSRARTPKDNAVIERFNRTLQEEWLDNGNFTEDIDEMNRRLTVWLEFYNFKRRHFSLGNMSPINYLIKYRKVLPMYPTSTHTYKNQFYLI